MEIKPVNTSLRWLVKNASTVLGTGVTEPGAVTYAGYEPIMAENILELLAQTVDLVTDYNPLPDVGEEVTGGQIYSYDSSLVYARQSHTRTEHDPRDIDVASLFAVYRVDGTDVLEWVQNETLVVGARRLHEGVIYELYNSIGTNNIHPPPQVEAHWRVWVEAGSCPDYEQRFGHNPYMRGDCVTFNSVQYWSLVDNNVYSPAEYPPNWSTEPVV